VEVGERSHVHAVEALVGRNLRERFPDFQKNLDMKLYDLRVVGCSMGSLRGNGRKLRRVVDTRQMVQPGRFGA
jgi:hypothetical protein